MNNKISDWEKLVATGGADSLFNTYPNDIELAGKINELFDKSTGEITPEIVLRDRQRFHQLPRRGEMRDENQASPTKNVILNKAQQLEVPEALAEIIDNIFDNFEKNSSKPKKLKITITIYAPTAHSSGEIIIQENSGGIPNNRILPLIQLGLSNRTIGGIGAWGEGFKMAVFSLGQEVEVFSTFPGERPLAIHFPKGWLDPKHALWKNWKVGVFEIDNNPPSEGSTTIRINNLLSQVLDRLGLNDSSQSSNKEVCQDLADYFGEIYSEKYHYLISQEYKVKIQLNVGDASTNVTFLDPVEERLRKNLAFLPWLRPIKWKRFFETELKDENRTARLNITIYAGVAATPEKYSIESAEQLSRPGIEMWGNGRKFSLKGRITDESVGWGYTYGGSGGINPLSGSSYRRLFIIAVFSSEDSRDIPWAAPVKNDYNRRSEFYAEIRNLLARTIKLFKSAHNLLDFVLHMFSQSWLDYKEEQKLEIIFRDVQGSKDLIENFKNSRFGKKILTFQPNLSFKQIGISPSEPTTKNLYEIDPTQITDIVKAAQVTKQSVAERIKFIKAIFPNLDEQSEIEEKLGLEPNEDFIYE